MRDFPSCFGENGVQVADSSSSVQPSCPKLGLGVSIDDSANQCSCKVDIKPWLFSKRKGSKNLYVDSGKVVICWDLSNARFGSGPEPVQGFYLAVAFDREMVFLLGDLKKEAYKKIDIRSPLNSDAVFIAKREHVLGRSQEAQVEVPWQPDHFGGWSSGGSVLGFAQLAIGDATGTAVFMFQTCVSTEKFSTTGQSALDLSALTWSCSQKLRDYQVQAWTNALVAFDTLTGVRIGEKDVKGSQWNENKWKVPMYYRNHIAFEF
ncbi:Detected protein of unknown function [Hibiscus syriacus]|uniref:Uncharacterized protein n=1 Tax=Hibiscus syriacus TaxID=106335 RepID=A0A6A2YF55_HIBSY|nr:Detected protein of unknown function [Hibiscus syriacus]